MNSINMLMEAINNLSVNSFFNANELASIVSWLNANRNFAYDDNQT